MAKVRLRGGPLNGNIMEISLMSAPPYLYFFDKSKGTWDSEDVRETTGNKVVDINSLVEKHEPIVYMGFILLGRQGAFVRYYHEDHPHYELFITERMNEYISELYDRMNTAKADRMIETLIAE